MKVSFPYMGPVTGYKKLFEVVGHEVIVPPRPTQKTIDLGSKYSPEFACFPFKVLMGSYIEACEQGAEVIFSSGGHGPCRAGFYGEVHDRVLKSLGYDVDVVIFDEPAYNYKRFLKNAKRLKGDSSLFRLGKAVWLAYRIIHDLDSFEKKIRRISPYEVKGGRSKKVWQEINSRFDEVYNRKDLKEAEEYCEQLIEDIEYEEVDESKKIKIGIIGEIYVVMEPSINMEIEDILNQLGCETERSQYLSEWVDFNIIPGRGSHEEKVLEYGEEYIKIVIGGHAKQSVGHIIDYSKRGFDGIVHLKPFACLPELVSESIIPEISKEYDIPVFTFSLDEQTGTANNSTRIEAFVDMLKRKKLSRQSA